MDPNNFRRATGTCVGSSHVFPIYQRMFELVENRLFLLMQMTPHYWQLFASQQTDLLVLLPFNRDLALIQAWCNHWCMILNPNKSKALVFIRSRTVNPPYGDLVVSGVSIRACLYLDILGVKFDSKLTFEDHVRGIVSLVSQRIGILRLVKRIFVDTSVLLHCYFAFVLSILEYCSRCGDELLNVTFSFLSASCIRWPGFVSIRVSCSVIDVAWPGLVCCARLIRSLITACLFSELLYLLLLEFDITELRPQLIHWSLKYQGVVF